MLKCVSGNFDGILYKFCIQVYLKIGKTLIGTCTQIVASK